MNKISAEIVEQTWQSMCTMETEELPKIVEQLTNEQPIILAYLMAVGDDFFNQDERELLLYLGIVIWKIMSQGNKPLPEVSEEQLDEIEDSNMKMVEYLEDESDNDFITTVATLINNYNQQEVLKYVVEALMEDSEDEYDIRAENTGILMIHLKTIIDCFDR